MDDLPCEDFGQVHPMDTDQKQDGIENEGFDLFGFEEHHGGGDGAGDGKQGKEPHEDDDGGVFAVVKIFYHAAEGVGFEVIGRVRMLFVMVSVVHGSCPFIQTGRSKFDSEHGGRLGAGALTVPAGLKCTPPISVRRY